MARESSGPSAIFDLIPGELGSGVAQRLAALGVTSLFVLRDEQTTAVALEGWAFDVVRSAETAARAISADPAAIRILRPIVESAVRLAIQAS